MLINVNSCQITRNARDSRVLAKQVSAKPPRFLFVVESCPTPFLYKKLWSVPHACLFPTSSREKGHPLFFWENTKIYWSARRMRQVYLTLVSDGNSNMGVFVLPFTSIPISKAFGKEHGKWLSRKNSSLEAPFSSCPFWEKALKTQGGGQLLKARVIIKHLLRL